jgi:hypothetical protein
MRASHIVHQRRGKGDALAYGAATQTDAYEAAGLHQPLPSDGHRHYLPWHREKVFRRGKVES